MNTPGTLTHETIEGVNGPCRAYSGMAAALKTRGGIEVVVLCASTENLITILSKIDPGAEFNPKGFYPVSLIHDRHIKRKDEL
jgi:hypothetical protein